MIEEKNDLMKNIGGEGDNNLRKYLILGGGVFVLFVIGIVVSKFMFSEPKKNNTAVILPPEVEKAQKKEDTALFNDIPVENEFKKPEIDSPSETKEKPKKTEIKEKPQVTQTENVQPIKSEVKPEVKPEVVEVKNEKTKKEIKKVNPQSKTATQKYEYYIQVAAITRGKPSKKFLELIKKNGFNYKIVEVNVKGMKVKRVLVGGFKSYKEAKNYLVKVRKNISSSAFIKRLK